jgi:hypothetical protein
LAVADLPTWKLVLHVFASSDLAAGFAGGIGYVQSNKVAALRVSGLNSVLVAHFDEDRPATDVLDDAVPAILHGDADVLKKAQSYRRMNEEREAEGRRKEAQVEAVVSAWTDIIGIVEAAPGVRITVSEHGSHWDAISLNPMTSTSERLSLGGHFVPEKRGNDGFSLSRHEVTVERCPDGLRLLPRMLVNGSTETLAWRQDAIATKAREFGWTWTGGGLECRCAPADLIARMQVLTEVKRAINVLCEEGAKLSHLTRLRERQEIMEVLTALSEGRSLTQTVVGSTARLETKRGGKNIPHRLCAELSSEGLVAKSPMREDRPYSAVYVMTEVGSLLVAGDLETARCRLAAAREAV